MREDVVVIGGGRAARAKQRRQPGARRRPLDARIDPRPRRVELDQPLEERRLLRVPARGPLVEVVMAVDQPGRREAAGAVDSRPVWRAPGPTAVIRLPSTTMCPSWWTAPLTVAIAQPSMISTSPVLEELARSVGVRLSNSSAQRTLMQPTPLSMRRIDASSASGSLARARQPDRVEDLLVARAAAQVAGQRLADLCIITATGCAPAGRAWRRSARACRSRTAPRPPPGTPPGSGAARPRRRAPRR